MMLWISHRNFQGEDPRKFEVIVKFCISVYFTQYFEIKVTQHIKYGPEKIVLSLDILRITKAKSQTEGYYYPRDTKRSFLCSQLRRFDLFGMQGNWRKLFSTKK